jgi:hypothetical protein
MLFSLLTYNYRCLRQTTLDTSGFNKVPRFTREGFMEHIGELLVSSSDSISLVNQAPFRRCFKFVQPNLKESDIPRNDEARHWIVDKVEHVIAQLREELKVFQLS